MREREGRASARERRRPFGCGIHGALRRHKSRHRAAGVPTARRIDAMHIAARIDRDGETKLLWHRNCRAACHVVGRGKVGDSCHRPIQRRIIRRTLSSSPRVTPAVQPARPGRLAKHSWKPRWLVLRPCGSALVWRAPPGPIASGPNPRPCPYHAGRLHWLLVRELRR